ncbi:MAG: Hsp20/alpha crystallin family protein [Deltaproteobacteria bacterium]|nr:MAG: Hsp20/alpha crystallin family protein [Deltaproteobacteria bacterium]
MAFYGLDPRRGDPWSAFDQLRREMDSWLGSWRSERRPNAARLAWSGAHPPVNLYETPDSLVLATEVPGVREEDLEVSVRANQIQIKGQREIAYAGDASVHRRERQAGSFQRTVELPIAVDSEKADASYRNGVLMVRMPKSAAHQPRRISVRSS